MLELYIIAQEIKVARKTSEKNATPKCTHRNTCSHGSMIKLLVDIFIPFVIAGLASLDDSDSDDCVPPTRKHQRICNEETLQLSLSSGCY